MSASIKTKSNVVSNIGMMSIASPKCCTIWLPQGDLSKYFRWKSTNSSLISIVKIPFEIDASEKRVKTYYSLCEKCTEKDYSYVITGEIVDKNNKNLTLEIKVTEMPIYDFLLYNGKIVKVGDNIKYEMKYSKVIIY